MARKDFKKHNDGFICARCGVKNEPASKNERNHCFSCLFSVHVDEDTPGDRKSSCCGFMEPVSLDHKGKKGFMIRHRCVQCGKEILNRMAEEDSRPSAARLSQ